MLNNKTLQKLALVTFLVAVPILAILYHSGSTAIKSKNTPLYPSLVTDLGLLSKITIEDQTQTLTLVRNNDVWAIAERNNYPVATNSVQELVSALAALRIVEPKTTNPAYYNQLDVDEIDQANSKAVKVSVLDNKEQPIAQVLIGKRDGELIGEQYIERLFARKVADQQTWLVQGTLSLSNNVKDWLNQPLLGLVPVEQVKNLAISRPQSGNLMISKLSADQQDFTLQGVAEAPGMRLDLDAINTLPFEISEIEILDVVPADTEITQQQKFDWTQSLAANLETFDGVTVTLNALKQDDQVLAKVVAQSTADASAETKEKVDKFNTEHKNWYYVLSPEAYKTLNLASSDFLQANDQVEPTASIN